MSLIKLSSGKYRPALAEGADQYSAIHDVNAQAAAAAAAREPKATCETKAQAGVLNDADKEAAKRTLFVKAVAKAARDKIAAGKLAVPVEVTSPTKAERRVEREAKAAYTSKRNKIASIVTGVLLTAVAAVLAITAPFSGALLAAAALSALVLTGLGVYAVRTYRANQAEKAAIAKQRDLGKQVAKEVATIAIQKVLRKQAVKDAAAMGKVMREHIDAKAKTQAIGSQVAKDAAAAVIAKRPTDTQRIVKATKSAVTTTTSSISDAVSTVTRAATRVYNEERVDHSNIDTAYNLLVRAGKFAASFCNRGTKVEADTAQSQLDADIAKVEATSTTLSA